MPARGSTGSGGGSDANNLLWSVVFFAIVGGLLFLAYEEYEEVDKFYGYALGSYEDAVTQNRRLRGQMKSLQGGRRFGGRGETDKVLWTEKFLAIGKQINNHLWLTDVYLDNAGTGSGSGSGQILVIKGVAYPSTDGHIFEVANYIERLECDHARFMSDFKEITFEGANIQNDNGVDIIRFKLYAWYDKGIREQKTVGEGCDQGGAKDNTAQAAGTGLAMPAVGG